MTSTLKPRLCLATLISLFASASACAHHGVAGVGAAALEGPGAPVESASSAVLPEGKWLTYMKLDHAKFKTYNTGDTQVDYNQYWMLGLGYGVTPWFSAYVFAPYNRKVDTDQPAGGTTQPYNSSGWADVSIMGQIGFKYDKGFKLVPAKESLDDMEDWHFTLYTGMSLPTGDANKKAPDGSIDPGKSTSFGKPSYSLGFTATKMLSKDWTFNAEVSTIRFQTYRYDDNNTTKFGTEDRLNLGLAYRAYANPAQKLRLDLCMEAQYLNLGRDSTNGAADEATGGKMLYLLPGVRVYKDNMSLALGIKKAVWTDLNEDAQQQGAEGKEKYRLILSASAMF